MPAAALTEGVDEHLIDGVPVRITGADRRGLLLIPQQDRSGRGLRSPGNERRRATMEDLWCFALLCRAANVIRPYTERLT